MPNFGESYRNKKSAIYREAVNSKPHLVLLLLGSNDSKNKHWKGAQTFREALKSIALEFAGLASKPLVVLMTPPPASFDPRNIESRKVAYGLDGERIEEHIVPAVREAAVELGLQLIDIFDLYQKRFESVFSAVHRLRAACSVLSDDPLNTSGEQVLRLRPGWQPVQRQRCCARGPQCGRGCRHGEEMLPRWAAPDGVLRRRNGFMGR